MQVDFMRDRSLTWARDLFVLSFCLRGMAFVDMAFLTKKYPSGYIVLQTA